MRSGRVLLLAAARTSDVVDATVVVAAIEHRAAIVTSDRGDVERLLAGAPVPVIDV